MKYNKLYTISAALGILAVSQSATAADPIVNDIEPYTVSDLKSPKAFTFVDGQRYACLSDDGRTIDFFDAAKGTKLETTFDVANTRETQLGSISGFRFSDNMTKILVWTDVTPVYRRSFKAKYYVYDIRSRVLRPLSTEFDFTQVPVFSPDARMVAFVHDADIYIKKLDFNTQIAVTTDGEPGKILNGVTDWVYEEEFVKTSLMAFSPDNTTLCFVKSNETEVPAYTLPQYGTQCSGQDQYRIYPGTMTYKYPAAGYTNSTADLYCYEISNRKVKEIPLADKNIEYIPRLDFGPNSETLLVTTLNRDQNRMEIYSVNPRTTLSTSLLVEQSEAWVLPETYEDMTVVSDGIVIMSGRTGHVHLYKYAFNGTLTRTITSGDFDVTDFYGFDARGTAYYQSATPTPIDRAVCSIDLKGLVTRLSPDGGGTAKAHFAPGCTTAMLSYSNVKTPDCHSIIDAKGRTVRAIEDNAEAKARWANMPEREFVKVPGDNGLQFNAYVIKPADFDPLRRYPVVVYQYSGPGSQEVLNKWSVSWQQYFASKGYVVFCMDGRGTGCRGTEFMYSVYKNLGHYETIDQLAGARWLAAQSWVDSKRIGIHGWSYGGYETLMCLQAANSPFAAGVAVAPVTDWRLYDSIYTERYMLTPQQNEDGYLVSAPLTSADNMNSRLLLMWGTADDNVHPANSLLYAGALQYNGILFDAMVFPDKNHSIYGCNARAVVYGNMFRFFENTLKK